MFIQDSPSKVVLGQEAVALGVVQAEGILKDGNKYKSKMSNDKLFWAINFVPQAWRSAPWKWSPPPPSPPLPLA